MLEQDLIRLCESEDYVYEQYCIPDLMACILLHCRNNPTVNREELMGFQVPPFMLQKIKADMRQQRRKQTFFLP